METRESAAWRVECVESGGAADDARTDAAVMEAVDEVTALARRANGPPLPSSDPAFAGSIH